MFTDQIVIDILLRGALLSAMALCWLIFLVRIIGLRSFSKMASVDFVTTLAVGSLMAGASQATGWAGFLQSLIAMAALMVVQYAHARMRITSDRFESAVENEPRLLMRDGKVLHDALRDARVSPDDLAAKLRAANVLDPAQVRAVVLETTGDVSVLHGDRLDDRMLNGVRGAGRAGDPLSL